MGTRYIEGQYYDEFTKPIKDEHKLEELDSFIKLDAEELYLHIKCLKC